MTDRVFIDTNILVYAYVDNVNDDLAKHKGAVAFLSNLIGKDVNISTQILNEVYSALKKNLVKDDKIKYYIEYCIEKYNVLPVTLDEVRLCLEIREQYRYS